MATITGALSNIVRTEIPEGIRELRVKLDPVWEDIIVTSQGVKRDNISEGWKFLQSWCKSVSGAYQFEPQTVLTGSSLAFEETGVTGVFPAPTGFPRRAESTAPGFFQTQVELKEARGNLFVPLKWLQIDEFDSSVGSAVRKLIQGVARKVALAHAISFYTSDADKFTVISRMPASGAAAEHTVTIDNSVTDNSKANGRINMLHPGLLVDWYSSDFVTKRTTNNPWIITHVDYITNAFTMKETVAADANVAITAGDILTLRSTTSYAGSTYNQPSGLNSWMKNTGTISTINIDTAVHPEFKSYLPTAISGPLTEKVLTKHLGTFMERLGTMCELDTIITPAGVVHSYLENEDNLARYERNGRRLSIKGGWSDIDYAYHGKAFRWAISNFVEQKAAYVIKLGENNIKEYVPPTLAGTGSESGFPNEVRFVAQLGGAKGIFLHERLSTADVGDTLEAPFYRICELAPEQPQGVKLTGLDESIGN